MTNSTPAISVLMPVYNAGRFLVPALDSILAQTFSDFELIVLDGGSNSAILLRRLSVAGEVGMRRTPWASIPSPRRHWSASGLMLCCAPMGLAWKKTECAELVGLNASEDGTYL